MNPDKMIVRTERRAGMMRKEDRRFRPSAVPSPDQPYSLAEVAAVVQRRRWIILGSIVGGLLLALVASLLMTRKYESVCLLEINKESSDALGLDSMLPVVGNEADQTLDYAINMETQVTALESDTLALQVIRQLHLDTRPEFKWKTHFWNSQDVKDEASLPFEQAPHHREALLKVFRKNLSVKTVTNARMIEIHYLNPDRQVAADVVNTLANDYMDQYFLTRYTATAQASNWLTQQLADLKKQVEAAQQKLVDYQRQNGILGMDDANNIVMTRLEELNKQLTDAQSERITRQVITELVQSGNAELISGLAGDSLNANSATLNSLTLLQNLRTQQATLKVQYAQAATKYGAAYPTLVEMNNQLNVLNGSIQDEIHKISVRAQNDYLTALHTEQMLESSLDKQKAEANDLNDKAIQYTILKHEADSSSALYDALLARLKSADIIAGLRSTKLLVIDPGRPGADIAHPKFLLNSGIGLAAGLLLGVALAFAKESVDDSVRHPDQIEAAMMLPQLGMIPDFKFDSDDGAHIERWNWGRSFRAFRARKSGPYAIAPCRSSIADAYRQLRSSITLSGVELPKVLLVTSPLCQEGKTTTSINLAVVLAQQGAKVLLVDADLRHPSVESRLKIEFGSGLSSLLTSKDATPQGITAYADQPGLFVLGAGPTPPNPAELLGSDRMTKLIEQWSSEYDIVVMDASPVLSVTDAVVLSSRVDAVLLVARAAKTTRQSLLRTRDVLFRANAKIAGFVVNGADPNSYYSYQSSV